MQLLKHQFMLVPPPSYTGLAYTYTNLQQIKDKCINASDGFFNGVAEKIVLGGQQW